MSIVLKIFLTFFTDLSFYTKHTFHFIYVNQVIHIVILVDNVDNFVYNLIISLFADFSHVENFLDNFSLIHHSSTGFVHIARRGFFRLTDGYFFVRVEILKYSVDFSVPTFFATQSV